MQRLVPEVTETEDVPSLLLIVFLLAHRTTQKLPERYSTTTRMLYDSLMACLVYSHGSQSKETTGRG